MAHSPRSIENANKASSTPKQTPTQPVPAGYKSTVISVWPWPKRVPVEKKSRYHRYRKSTGMKAVGRSKAFWFLDRHQRKLLKQVWEDVPGAAMSHKGYSRISPLRPEIEPMTRTVPMYASSTCNNFLSPIPYLTEAGRESISRKVPKEQLQIRFQRFWQKMARLRWIWFFKERDAVRNLWIRLFQERDAVRNLWWSTMWRARADIGYKPGQRNQLPHFDEIPHRTRDIFNPARPNFFPPDGPFPQTRQAPPRTLARDILGPVHSSERELDTFGTVNCTHLIDSYLQTKLAVIMEFHGGGTTSIQQVNDTNLHQRLKKEYAKYVSSLRSNVLAMSHKLRQASR